MPVKAIALLSGGLDSALAVRLVQEQGVEVEGVHFISVFTVGVGERPGLLPALRVARELGVAARVVNFNREHCELVASPPHGYGSNMNPCIDCHIAMLRRAAERMAEVGARFVLTGEVLGQRPMSQRRDTLALIDREAGLVGMVLRPLSARLLPPTVPEREGWVDRERLLDIRGRSRKVQLSLSERYGLKAHSSPAGGCLLTDPGFSARLRDLLEASPGRKLDLWDVHLLKVGRHFRLDEATKAIVGRRERENAVIETFSRPEDLLLTTRDTPGPTTLLRGRQGERNIRLAASLTARYSRLRREPSVAVAIRPGRKGPTEKEQVVEVAPAAEPPEGCQRL